MTSREIVVARDFSKNPGGRYLTDGPNSGARFLNEILVPALKKSDRVQVDLDGTTAFGSSFLEEAFGGLVRTYHFSIEEIKNKLIVKSFTRPVYEKRVWRYINDAVEQKA